MDDNSFVLDNMVFSYSNLSTFCGCKYEWRLHYLDCEEKRQNVYAQFGSFCHKILEMYENGELKLDELPAYYEEYFDDEITEDILFQTSTATDKLYDLGLSYFQNGVKDLNLSQYKILGVEYECNFKIGDHEFIGYIDLLLEDENGDIIILDHKSAEYPYGKNGKPKKSTADKVKSYERQLYLYSKAVFEQYGKYPTKLVWNYFKSQKFAVIPFYESEYLETLQWAEDTIKEMYDEIFFDAKEDYFYCRNLCDYRDICEFANGG